MISVKGSDCGWERTQQTTRFGPRIQWVPRSRFGKASFEVLATETGVFVVGSVRDLTPAEVDDLRAILTLASSASEQLKAGTPPHEVKL